MITSAHTPDRPDASELADRATHGMSAGHAFVVDAFSLLDHRTRERTLPTEGAPPGHYLVVEDGGANRLLPLDRPIIHIGRGLIADIRLEDPHVSRRHAIIAIRGEGVRVLDDRSSNRTFVNGRAVSVAHLADGDVMRFGRAVFRYTEINPPQRGEPVRSIARVATPPAARGVGAAA